MPPDLSHPIHHAHKKNDPLVLAQLDIVDLEKLRLAEEILEARYKAQQRTSRLAVFASALVGYVALAGFVANAYQSYVNKAHLEEQAARETARWQAELKRQEQASTNKDFFDIADLVTDPSNPEKRLIGYSLIESFVVKPEFHEKAITILEESLNRELRESAAEPPVPGLSEPHDVAVRQIIQAMSATTSCRDLAYAARSVVGIVRHAHDADLQESTELFSLYIRRLFGRAVLVCREPQDLDSVRGPIREGLKRVPAVADLKAHATDVEVNGGIARLLVKGCVAEQEDIGSPECLDIHKKYSAACLKVPSADEQQACAEISHWRDPPPGTTAAGPGAQ